MPAGSLPSDPHNLLLAGLYIRNPRNWPDVPPPSPKGWGAKGYKQLTSPTWTGQTWEASVRHHEGNSSTLSPAHYVEGYFMPQWHSRALAVLDLAEVQHECGLGNVFWWMPTKTMAVSSSGSSDNPFLEIWLMLCGAMALFLSTNPREDTCGFMFHPNFRKKVGLIKRLTLVLPPGTAWPCGVEEAGMCDAVTSILAIVWAKPSGIRIAVARERPSTWDCNVTSWRLPCLLK
jgi:hypothetical protein